jgi:hypothetical protein
MTDDETIALRVTMIGGQRYADLIWRGMSARLIVAGGAASARL